MNIDLAFSSPEVKTKNLAGRTVAVFDVLRGTSTMISALAHGCAGIIPALTVEEARRIAAERKELKLLLGGERNALPVEGFDLSNSPRDYRPEKVRGRTLVMTTTNGTRALLAAQGADKIYIGAFLNLSALAQRLREEGRDVTLVCSGKEGLFCLEDTVCGGGVIGSLAQEDVPMTLSEPAAAARILYEYYEADIYGMLSTCEWGRYLQSIGLERDLRLCAQIDSLQIVPVFRDGKITVDR